VTLLESGHHKIKQLNGFNIFSEQTLRFQNAKREFKDSE